MKDDIKEILELHLYREDYNKLLDYITNLQEENENRISESLSYDLAKAKIKELEDRIDKAIEYIGKHFQDDEGTICKTIEERVCEVNYDFIDNLLNILKGEE